MNGRKSKVRARAKAAWHPSRCTFGIIGEADRKRRHEPLMRPRRARR